MSGMFFTLKSEDCVCPSYFAMSVHMRRNVDLLKVLHQAKPKLRKAMLKHLEPSSIKAICDCVLNILKSVVKMSPVQKRKLAGHKDHLRVLVKKDTPLKERRLTIVQKGEGFLTLVLGPVLKELASLAKISKPSTVEHIIDRRTHH
jgi:hypothetical protein